MLGNDIEAITLADLQSLVTNAVSEGTTIEYKRDFYNLDVPNPQQKVKQHEEMLKDISSFANTIGGDLIIGIDEKRVFGGIRGWFRGGADVVERLRREFFWRSRRPGAAHCRPPGTPG